MSNCCSNNFFSETLSAPDCSIPCLPSATPGAIFVGSTGIIYVLTDLDPCNLSNWQVLGSCCLSFTNNTNTITICCNEELLLTSDDNTVDITIDELTGIDFSANITMTFKDDYASEFDIQNLSEITFSDNNGIVVEITSPGVIRISGNSHFAAGVPVFTPTHPTLTNYYFDITNNVLYVWKPSTSTWVRINYLPSPVALFTYTKGALSATLSGSFSTSTQQGITLTYLWSGTGPAAVVFGTPTADTTSATFTLPGAYVITLTVTDSNGATKAYSETINIEAKAECDIKFSIPSSAFADINNPTDAEVTTWITANGPFNNRTILYYVGTGSILSPEYIWFYTC